ncbi:MAG: ABC transporter permease subunit [Ferrimicrobium sp.]
MNAVLIGGLISGCLYALVALGLVLIFRTTGAVNFAQGDVGSLGMFVALGLSDGIWAHLGVLPAVLLGLLGAAVVNVAIYVLLIRPLEGRRADLVTTLVVTLGVSQVIEGALPIVFGYNPYSLKVFQGLGSIRLVGMQIPASGLAIVISAAIALICFAFILYRTRVGLVLRMGASNPSLADLSGVPAMAVRLVLWSVAGVIAAWGVMLFSAYDSVSTTTMGGFLLASAVAASWGAFRSIPWTIAGAVVVGIVSNLVTRYSSLSLTQTTSLVLLLVVFVVLQRRGGKVVSRVVATKVTGIQIRPLYKKTAALGFGELGVLAVGGVVFWLIGGLFVQSLIVETAATAIMLCGLSLSVRYGGRLNLAGAAYAGVGAYVASACVAHHWPTVIAIVVGVAAAGIVGAGMGLATVGLETIFFVNLGLVASAVIGELALVYPGLTGGAEGMYLNAPFQGVIVSGSSIFGLVIVVVAVVILGLYFLYGRSSYASKIILCANDLRVSNATGLRSGPRFVITEAIAAAIVGSGALLLVLNAGYINTSDFSIALSNALIAGVIVGGGWGIASLVFGAAFIEVLPASLGSLTNWPPIIYGASLALVVVLSPNGFEGGVGAVYRSFAEWLGKRSHKSADLGVLQQGDGVMPAVSAEGNQERQVQAKPLRRSRVGRR